MDRKDELINKLILHPHPEGGYFSETYRSKEKIHCENGRFPHERNYSTAIYYLLCGSDISRFHRIKSDEVWHHYEGSALTIHMIFDNGQYKAQYLGKDLDKLQKPQLVVPAGTWFGATVNDPEGFTLCGCSVAPGFDFHDFEMADRSKMLQNYPKHEQIIRTLLPV